MQQPKTIVDQRGGEALERLLACDDVRTVLDIGSGAGEHAAALRSAGREVFTVSLKAPADHVGDFNTFTPFRSFDAVWACHVLEHQVDPGAFLRKCHLLLRPGGLLAVTVPPLKHAVVGGHVTLWNAGLLLYQLVLAGFDCSEARVGTYGYNLSVLVRKSADGARVALPELEHDAGDIARLADRFPLPVAEGFDGELGNVRWNDGDATPAPRAARGNVVRLERPAPPPKAVPQHVAIVALGPSTREYLRIAQALGGRSKYADEVWTINGLGDVLACDRVFHMDDVRIQEIRAAAEPGSNIAAMLAWMKTAPGPIITSRAHPDYPGLVEFPLEEVVNRFPEAYFNSTAAYAVAYAVYLGVKKLSVFGMDFTYPDAHDAERGRACVEFWLGRAAERGIKLVCPKTSSLLDAIHTQAERFYGYDTLELDIKRVDDKIRVSFTEKTTLPSAAEIEDRYDHDKHPSPLMKAVA